MPRNVHESRPCRGTGILPVRRRAILALLFRPESTGKMPAGRMGRMPMPRPHRAACLAMVLGALVASATAGAADIPPGRFVEVAKDNVGGHFFSQVIYAPTARGLVSWGTRTHSKPIGAHETQHFPIDRNEWIDAWPAGKEQAWAGKYKRWPDWEICAPVGEFYERDGVRMPRPNSSFHQVCWDEHNRRVLFYLGSMTFSYDPAGRTWKLLRAPTDPAQPPAMLLWSSLCYDPVNRQAILFGGGGIDSPDGRPHTWAMDAATDTWRKLELDTEPPARCNSRLVYDRRNRLIVLFGGDGQDRGLADTWVFDVTKRQWRQRNPPRSPHPRHGHAMCYLDKSGLVLLVGGQPVCDYRQEEKLARQTWVYDGAKDTWTPLAVETPRFHWASMENVPGTDEAILVTAHRYDHGRETYRFRYDVSIPVAKDAGVPAGTSAWKTERTTEWYADQPPADPKAHAEFLAALPANQWIEAKPPKSAKGRTWGSAIFDTDRGVAMKWGGGHSGYQGTDMAFYDVAANRFTIDRTPAFTPDPFDRWARRPHGRTYFNQPWTRHMRHTCAYDPVRKLGVFTDCGGSDFFDRKSGRMVKHTWLYDPAGRRWLEPVPQPFPGGGTHSPIAIPTPGGVLAYQHLRLYEAEHLWRFVGEAGKPETWGWREIAIEGKPRPRRHEHMTIVHDTKRDRLVFLSAAKREDRQDPGGDGEPELWFFDMERRCWEKDPKPAPGGVATREAVYVPEADAILAYGPARKDDPVWTRAYLCAEGRWVPLAIRTPQFTVHEVALEYDPVHKLAVLLWPPSFEQDIRPHLLRLAPATLPR